MAKEFQAITTQSELDSLIGERLKRQKEQYEEKLQGNEDLQNQLATLQSEIEAKNLLIEESKNTVATKDEEYSNLKTELDRLKINQLKQSIALKSGLPFEMASRLQGQDEQSISEDAKSLFALLAKQAPGQPLKDLEPNNINTEDSEYFKMLESLDL